MDFSGKGAVVTGAANGIGRTAAQQLARAGARVLLVDRDAAGASVAAAIVSAGGQARFVAADVSSAADVRGYVAAALDWAGGIDCFFNNAGIEGSVTPTAEYDEAMFDRVMAVNVKGVFLGLRHVLPVMLRQGRGAVVNTASTAALQGSPGLSAYVASKHAVLGMTRTAAAEVGPAGIRVNALCPGPTDTRMIHSLEEQAGSDAERFTSVIPLGRYATTEEIANVALFLLSDLSASVTGAAWAVDGGRTAASLPPRLPRASAPRAASSASGSPRG